ncbi:MAG: hypothetical protein ACXVJB_03050 [Mucilaginibacter sp.]
MPNHLSILGIIHTAISVFALIAAFAALSQEGKINPQSVTGKLYIWLTIITCLTGFPIMKTGHPTGGHYLGVIILILLPLAIYANRLFGKAGVYIQVILMSTTLFLSMIPAVIETLTRLPISHPLAGGPNDPILQKALLAVVLLYLVGVCYQTIKIRSQGKAPQIAGGVSNT